MINTSKYEYISIIVLNYNGKRFLDKCLSSIISQEYPHKEIILVDNASTDGSVEFVSIKYPQVRIIKNKVGLGFGGGYLKGVKAAKGEKILLVSNDTWMPHNLLTKLNKYFDSHKFDVIAPYQADYKGDAHPLDTTLIDPLGHHIYLKQKTISPFYLTGVCLFCKKDLYLKTKGMDSKFFLYVEDVDWFWRLLLLGYSFSYVPHTYISHKGGGSSGGHNTKNLKPDIFMFRNRNTAYMLLKNYSLTMLIFVIPIYATINVIEMLFFMLFLKINIVKSYLKSWLQVISNIDAILEDRRWIQKKRVISDIDIIKRMYRGSAKLAHIIQFYAK